MEKATKAPGGAREYSITKMCEWLEVSTSGYYEWRDRAMSATAARREHLMLLIKKAFDDSDATYGYRRVHAQLARWGEPCSPELVRQIMRELGLVPCQPRPWRHSLTEASAQPAPIPDLLRRDFTATEPGTKLVGDITYIPTWEGWLFLATVIDCHTQKSRRLGDRRQLQDAPDLGRDHDGRRNGDSDTGLLKRSTTSI